LTIPRQHIEEFISLSYVSAVVAKSGFALNSITRDYGVDVSVREIESFEGSLMDMGPAFECQLKATVNWSSDGNFIIYDLDAKTYNKLIRRHRRNTSPCFLVLLCLPPEVNDWVVISDEELFIRKCCYYYHINGDNEVTSNERTIRVRIPKTNVFTPEIIQKINDDVRAGVYE
jgi:hypothetical protein